MRRDVSRSSRGKKKTVVEIGGGAAESVIQQLQQANILKVAVEMIVSDILFELLII